MTRRIIFTADYNHRWPSRAVTHFRAGTTLTVKAEVRDAAIAKGKATDAEEPATRENSGQASRRESLGRVDGRGSRSDKRRVRGDELRPDVGAGADDGVPVVPDAGE